MWESREETLNSVLGWGGGPLAREHIKEGFTEEVMSEK